MSRAVRQTTMRSAMMAARAWLTSNRSTGLENLDDLLERPCPPCCPHQGRVYANHLNPDTPHDFAGALVPARGGWTVWRLPADKIRSHRPRTAHLEAVGRRHAEGRAGEQLASCAVYQSWSTFCSSLAVSFTKRRLLIGRPVATKRRVRHEGLARPALVAPSGRR